MIMNMNNKNKNFYEYLGKLFGSRSVESFIHDRIYDDSDKEWYIYYDRGKARAFVSINNNKIKNVYSENKGFLVAVLQQVNREENIIASIVPKVFIQQYREAGFAVKEHSVNFVEIRGNEYA